MLQRGERTHLRIRVERIAHANRSRQRNKALQESVGNALVQNQTRASDTRLPLVVEDGPRGAVYCRIQVCIVENDIRALAAQLQLHTLQIPLRRFNNTSPSRRRTRECNLADAGMLSEALSGRVAIAWHNVHHARWKANLGHEFSDAQGRERGDFRRLEHNRIPRCECRSHLPACEHERKIPRDNLAHDSNRRALHVIQETRLDRNHGALELVGHATEIAEACCRARHIERPGIADRVTGVQ